MLHPSYTELMEKINKEGETGEEPVINSRYSIVMAFFVLTKGSSPAINCLALFDVAITREYLLWIAGCSPGSTSLLITFINSVYDG